MSLEYKSYRNGQGPIPPRWLNCPRKSIQLIANKFLAFKTPLGTQFDDEVPAENRFTPSMLISSMKSHKVRIGLWIDLTNTDRFYNKKEVEDEGIRYVKLHLRGHGECPASEQVNIFVEMCDKFIKKSPLEIIAVHCTHGFNRSGFMIVSYLVMKEDWSCDKAVQAFTNARPPGIYKKDYLQALYAKLDEADAAPPPPELPEWCFEEDSDLLDDDGEALENSGTAKNHHRNGGGKRRFHKNKKNPTFMEGVNGVFSVEEGPKLYSIQKKIQDICGFSLQGFPGCQPVSMTKKNFGFLADKPYMVSWKADGTRYMMLIDGKKEVYFADRDFSIFCAPSIDFREKHDLNQHLCDTLLDGEMVIDEDPKTKIKYPRYLIYDAIRIHGKDITNDDFHLRFRRIATDIIHPRHAAIEQGLINKSKEAFGVRRKDFWDTNVQTTAKLLSKSFKSQLLHEPDGLIFQPVQEPYVTGRCDTVLKWKPPTHNSVDFKMKKVTQSGEGLLRTIIVELYVGGLELPYSTMKYSKDMKDLNGKIIECKLGSNQQWIFMRERTDKSFPNSFATAQGVHDSILNPIGQDFLLDFIDKHGYRRPDQELMPPPPKRPRP